ncbi:MAG: hypothetical protein ACE5J7_00875 [Candidatus Aenigmatarchaeota archaeon]
MKRSQIIADFEAEIMEDWLGGDGMRVQRQKELNLFKYLARYIEIGSEI